MGLTCHLPLSPLEIDFYNFFFLVNVVPTFDIPCLLCRGMRSEEGNTQTLPAVLLIPAALLLGYKFS